MAQTPKVLEVVDDAMRTNYTPRHLLPQQVKQESGGRQFDKNGRVLEGRYPDGSKPAPGKVAFGAGQIQVGTARETAERHGIPFSESRLKSDRNYNLRLADAHMGDLKQRYGGDIELALAAYHSGSGTVDKAIREHGRANFTKGLGPVGRHYVTLAGKSGSSQRTSVTVSGTQNFFEGLESTLGPEVAASQNVKSEAGAIFGSDGRVAQETGEVRSKLQRQGAAVDVLDQVTQAAQASQMGAAIRKVEETRQISDQIVTATQALQRETKPVFEARGRVANQLDQINMMNPLERGIRGIFDSNYDTDYLQGQLKNFDTTLDMRMHDFDYLNKLHSVALGEVERRYGLDTAVSDLIASQAKEDLTLVGLSLANTQGFLDASMGEIGNQANIIAAKATATRDILGRLDSVTTKNLMTQAQTNGGVVKYGGVEISYAQLRESAEASEQRDWAIEGYKIGIASQRMDFAEKSADNLMQYATREQLESWIEQGGKATMPDGTVIQLPQDKLTSYLQTHRVREEGMAQDVAAKIPGAEALRMGASAMTQSANLYQRASGFFKPGTPQNEQMATALRAQEGALRELIQAQKEGKPQAVINALVQKMGVAQQGVGALVDTTILQSVGGDKQAAQYVSAFVKGVELSDGDAASAVVHFAIKGGLPEQLKASPAARQVFAQALKIVAENRTDKNGKPLSAAALKQLVTDKVLSQAGATVGQQNFDRLFTTLPQTAAQDGHPIGRIPQSQWGSMRAAAEREAAPAMAAKLKTTPDKILRMVQTGKPASTAPADLKLWEAFSSGEGASQWNGLEQQELVEQLDSIPSLVPGQSNSKLLVDYMRSTKLNTRMERFSAITRNSSFGDYVLSPMINGVMERNVNEYAGILDDSRAAVYQDATQRAKQFDTAYARRPDARAHMILSSIDGVGKAGADELMKFLRPRLEPSFAQKAVNTIAGNASMTLPVLAPLNGKGGRSVVQAQEAEALRLLQETKFDNPRAEAYRKKAIAGWGGASTQTGTFMENLMDALSTVAPSIGQ